MAALHAQAKKKKEMVDIRFGYMLQDKVKLG